MGGNSWCYNMAKYVVKSDFFKFIGLVMIKLTISKCDAISSDGAMLFKVVL